MDKNRFRQLMEGYLKGSLPASDRELLQRWYDSFGDTETGVSGLESSEAAQRIRDEMHAEIQQATGLRVAFETRKRKWSMARRIAAAATLLIVLGGVLWYVAGLPYLIRDEAATTQHLTFYTVKTTVRQVKRLTLADGSIIHINANSTVRVPQKMDGKRLVFLDEGEAFFEVAKDTLRPFVVETAPGLRVEVLGTIFNIKSYRVLPDISVVVNQGEVRVSDTTYVLGDLTANTGLTYHKANRQHRITPKRAAGDWMSGIVQLEKADFDELALALYNLYGVRLRSDDPRTAKYRYNVSLRTNRSLEDTMDIICRIHKTNYRRAGNEIIIYS